MGHELYTDGQSQIPCCTLAPHSHWVGRPNEPLNTEYLKEIYRNRLERRYGKEADIEVGVYPKVVKDDGRERIAGLIFYGTVDGLRVLETLGTYAISHISEKLPNRIRKIHNKIADGALIGEAFINDGYGIGRNSLGVREMRNPTCLQRAFSIGSRTGYTSSKVYISQFLVCDGKSKPVVYADLAAEIRSPDNTSPAAYFDERSRRSALTSAFEDLEIDISKIWNMTKNGLRHDKFPEEFHTARAASIETISKFESHMQSILEDPSNFDSIIKELEASEEIISKNVDELAKKYPQELYSIVV